MTVGRGHLVGHEVLDRRPQRWGRSPARSASGNTPAHGHRCGTAVGSGTIDIRPSRWVHNGSSPALAKSSYSWLTPGSASTLVIAHPLDPDPPG